MKIGIIVYSQTNNTHSVAERIKDILTKKKLDVSYERIEIEGKADPGAKDLKFTNLPNINEFDKIIFGAPIHAFQLCSPMRFYLTQLESLAEKKVFCFVTHHFPFSILGGKQGLSKMEKLCLEKNADIIGKKVIDWSSKKREAQIEDLIKNIKNSL